MNKKTIFIALGLAILLLFQHYYYQVKKDDQELIVGTNAEFPPFTFRSGQEIIGFDIDVAKEVAIRMGREISFKDMPFEALLPELILNHVDFLAAGMSATEERAKRVSFTKPYLAGDPLVLLTLADIPLNSLEGKSIVVNEGYTADLYMSTKSGFDLVRLNAPADAFLALKNGRVDAFVTSQSTVRAFLDTQEASAYHYIPLDGTSETCCLVLAKNNLALLEEIQQVLDEMEKDGTLQQLKNKWKL